MYFKIIIIIFLLLLFLLIIPIMTIIKCIHLFIPKYNIFLFFLLSYIGQFRLDKGSGTERVMDPGRNLSQDGLKPGSQCLIDSKC